jgi:hypothetical protein
LERTRELREKLDSACTASSSHPGETPLALRATSITWAMMTFNNKPTPGTIIPKTMPGLPVGAKANFNGPLLLDADRVARAERIKKLVTEQIDRHDAAVVPDVIHQESGK